MNIPGRYSGTERYVIYLGRYYLCSRSGNKEESFRFVQVTQKLEWVA